MRKEILPEMFNYNKYPGPDFVYVADLLKSDACQFTVLENHKDALDATRNTFPGLVHTARHTTKVIHTRSRLRAYGTDRLRWGR